MKSCEKPHKEVKNKYVLLWKDSTENLSPIRYFVNYNLYLSSIFTDIDIDKASLMTLDRAKEYISRMSDIEKWSIWSVKTGLVLDKEDRSYRNELEIQKLKDRIKELEKNEIL
jgi:hypothetical protein